MFITKLGHTIPRFSVNLLVFITLVCGLLAFSPPVPGQAAGPNPWEYQNPIPQSGTLLAINGTSSTDVFAVGQKGSILHYDGTNWTKMDSGTMLDLRRVWCAPGSDPMVVGDGGLILRYHDHSWTPMYTPSLTVIQAIWGSSDSDLIAIDTDGNVLRYDGNSNYIWTLSETDINNNILGLWKTSTQYFAVGLEHSIYNSVDGAIWNKMTLSDAVTGNLTDFAYFTAIWGASDSEVYVAGVDYTSTLGMNSFVLRYDGSDWSVFHSEAGSGFYSIWGTSAANFFCGDYDKVMHYDGTWHSGDTGSASVDFYIYGLWGSSTTDIFGVGGGGTIVHSTHNGSNWSSQVTALTTRTLTATWGSSPSDVYSVGASGTILHTQDGGNNWIAMNNSAFNNYYLNDVWGSSVDNVFTAGYAYEPGSTSHILRCTNGTDWNSLDLSGLPSSSLNSIWGSSASDIFAVGYDSNGNTSLILHSVDSVTWSRMPASSFPNVTLYDVWGLSFDHVFAVGYDEQAYTSVALFYNGSLWTQIDLSGVETVQPLKGVWGSSPDNVFIVGGSGMILHYDGLAWSKMQAGNNYGFLNAIWGFSATDVFAAGNDIIHYNGSSWSPVAGGAVFFLNGIWGTSFGDLFAVGNYGAIIHGFPHQDIVNGGSALLPAGQSSLSIDLNGQQNASFAISELAGPKETSLVSVETGQTRIFTFNQFLRVTTSAPNGSFLGLVQYHYTDPEFLFSGVLAETDLRLYSYDVNQPGWVLAVDGNTAGSAQWMGDNPAPLALTSVELGQYGVDTTHNLVWAVVDHATDFKVQFKPVAAMVVANLAELALLPSGGSYDFGSHPIGSDNQTTLAIVNYGDINLELDLPLTLSGPGASQFSVVQSPPGSIAPFIPATFIVSFDPTSPGSKSAVLTIHSSDYFDGTYVLNLSGQATGGERIQGVGGEVSSINRFSLAAPWLFMGGVLVISGAIVAARRRKSI